MVNTCFFLDNIVKVLDPCDACTCTIQVVPKPEITFHREKNLKEKSADEAVYYKL